MSFINEIYLRAWVQLTHGYKQGGWRYIYGKSEGGRMASDASCKCSSFLPSHHACSPFLQRELLDCQSCHSIILQSQLHRQPITHHIPRGPGAYHETGQWVQEANRDFFGLGSEQKLGKDCPYSSRLENGLMRLSKSHPLLQRQRPLEKSYTNLQSWSETRSQCNKVPGPCLWGNCSISRKGNQYFLFFHFI